MAENESSKAVDLLQRMQRQMGVAGADGDAPTPVWRAIGVDYLGQSLAVPLDQVMELSICENITPIPLTRRWVRGITSLRGQLLTVVDLSSFLGGAESRLSRDARLLVLQDGGLDTALLVSKVLGLRQFEVDLEERSAEDLAPELKPYIDRVVVSGDQDWLVFSIARLVQDEKFSRLGRTAA